MGVTWCGKVNVWQVKKNQYQFPWNVSIYLSHIKSGPEQCQKCTIPNRPFSSSAFPLHKTIKKCLLTQLPFSNFIFGSSKLTVYCSLQDSYTICGFDRRGKSFRIFTIMRIMKILMYLHKLYIDGVFLPEYKRFMGIHEDFPMICIESHRCIYGMSKQTKHRAYHSWQLVFRNHVWNPADLDPLDFMKSVRNLLDFTWNPYEICQISPEIRRISWNPYEIRRISWMWAFAWWSSVGLSFERPTIMTSLWHVLNTRKKAVAVNCIAGNSIAIQL